jgi:hypothetical protein
MTRRESRPSANTGAARDPGANHKSETTIPPWEPSAWFRDAITRAVKLLPNDAHGPGRLTVGSLTGWSVVDAASSAEDRRCDRCGEHVPPTRPDAPPEFFTGAMPASHPLTGARALFAFGLCRSCAELEGLDVEGAIAS